MEERPAKDLEEVLDCYGSMLYRLCLVMLRNSADAEDAVQEVLLKYLQKAPDFVTARYQKAWLLKVAANQCRDMLRLRWRFVPLEDALLYTATPEPENRELLEALMQVPEKYRLVLMLHYVEGYTSEEIGKLIGRTPSAVRMRLRRGRELLEKAYGEE